MVLLNSLVLYLLTISKGLPIERESSGEGSAIAEFDPVQEDFDQLPVALERIGKEYSSYSSYDVIDYDPRKGYYRKICSIRLSRGYFM